MLSISSALKEQSVSGAAAPACKAKIKLKSGKEITLTQSELWEGGFSMDDATSGSGSFDIGQVITNRLKLSLNDSEEQYSVYDFLDAEVTAWRGGVLQDSTTELLQCGSFIVSEQQNPDSSVDLTCLDNMSKTEIPYSDVSTTYPATIQTIVQDICNHCNIVLATSQIDNGGYVVSERPNDEALTCRDVLHYAAQISGSFARCDALGRMELRWYDENATKHKITAIKSFTPENQDIIITGIQVADDEKQNSLYGEKGYVLEVSDNPLIEAGKAPTIAAHLGKKIVGMSFRPLDLTCILDPSAEAGDPAEVTDRKGNTHTCWITNMTYTVGQDTKITCDAESPSDRAAVRFSEQTKAIVENRKKIEKERTERETAIEDISKQLAESSGMYTTAKKQDDGSTIYYVHDKPELDDSQVVWKLTATALGISTDGGETYPYGLDVSGTAILNRIYTIGLNADYIKTGSISASDKDGNELFYVNVETGEVRIASSSVKYQDESLDEHLDSTESELSKKIEKAYTDATLTADELIVNAVKEYVKTSDLEQFKEEISTQFTQTSDSFQMTFSKVESALSDLTESTNEGFNEIKEWIRFQDGKIILGKSENALELTLQNDRISFTSNGVEVAYFSNNQMHVDSIVVNSKASIVGLKIQKSGRHIQIS